MNFWDSVLENLQALGLWLARGAGRILAIFFALGAVAAALAALAIFLAPSVIEYFAPPLDMSRNLYAMNRPIAFTFLDANGKVAGHRGAIVGDRLKLEDMPAYLPAAFIAVEDKRFYSHGGIDMRGLLRAMWTNFRAGKIVQGGSTIDQQTAKILFLDPKRTYRRKIHELIDAESLEKSLSKKQILALYLNRIYLGSGAYGVDAAARVYFGKSARDVTVAQAAMLATLTTAPSVFSPRRDLPAAQQRASRVLTEMAKTDAISRKQARYARAHPAVVAERALRNAHNYFFDTAAGDALKLASAGGQTPSGDLTVHTTLDPRLQETARRSLRHVLAKRGRHARAHQGAVIVMKPDGAIVALIGGRNYEDSVFDRATQAKRQPGSAFKPFVYLTALESGLSPWDTRTDQPVDIHGWQPANYGGRSFGTITLASALAHSVNTVTANLGQEVGISNVIEAAKRVGIESPLENNASLALGTSEVTPLELTAAYAAFANGGMRVHPYTVTEVDERSGRVLYKRTPPRPQRVIAQHVDRDLVEMLYGVVTQGTGRAAALDGHEAAGKTGTTQDYRDAWFAGFTADYVACVWIGNDNSSPMRNVTGGSLPADVWKSVMTVAEKGLPATPLDKSAPPPAVDENGVVVANTGEGVIDNSVTGSAGVDEESGGMPGDEYSSSGRNQGSNGARNGGNWWDWIFGGDKVEDRPAPPPPQSPMTRQDDSDRAPPERHARGFVEVEPAPPPAAPMPPREIAPPPDETQRYPGPPPRDPWTHPPRRIGAAPPEISGPVHDEGSPPPPPPRAGPPPPDANYPGPRDPDGHDSGDSDDPGY